MLRSPFRQSNLDAAGREYNESRRIQQELMTQQDWLKVGILAAGIAGLIAILKRRKYF